jgi:hypothetical protein
MNKMVISMMAALGLVGSGVGADRYVFSADGKNAAIAPRTLPANGRDFETGRVVSNLSTQSVETLVKCGWYRVVVPKVELEMLQYQVVMGYDFDQTNGTATARVTVKDGAPVKRYTQYKIIGALMKLGKWDTVKAFLVEQNMYDLFMGAQYIATDDPNFFAAKKHMAQLLGVTDCELDEVLEGCIDD